MPEKLRLCRVLSNTVPERNGNFFRAARNEFAKLHPCNIDDSSYIAVRSLGFKGAEVDLQFRQRLF